MAGAPAGADEAPAKRKKKKRLAEEPPPEVQETTNKSVKASEAPAKSKKQKGTVKNQEIAELAAPAPAAEADGKPRGKKRRRRTADSDAKAAPADGGLEEQRRELQRKVRETVLRLRAEGKTEEEIARAKRELKFKHPVQKPDGNRARKANEWREWLQGSQGQDARKEKLQIKHDLVIIPVVWRGRHDRQDVERVAEDIKACVAQQGVDAWIDSRRHYTPGQKFAHWEHRGVMLRVEVGPEDIKAGVCRVCRAKTPGDYKSVERKRVRLPPAGGRALLLALKEWGLSAIDVERRKGDSDDEEEHGEIQATGDKAAAAEAVPEADDLEGNWSPAATKGKAEGDAAAKKGRKKKRI